MPFCVCENISLQGIYMDYRYKQTFYTQPKNHDFTMVLIQSEIFRKRQVFSKMLLLFTSLSKLHT